MVKIRLARTGAKKRPFFHLVATDSRSSRDGKFIERLGYYNPGATGGEQRLVFDGDRIEHWTKTGAQVSPRVAFLIKEAAKGEQSDKPARKKLSKKAAMKAKKVAEEAKAGDEKAEATAADTGEPAKADSAA